MPLTQAELSRRCTARALTHRGLIMIHRQIPIRDKEAVDAFILECKQRLAQDMRS